MLNQIMENTKKYLACFPKEFRKSYGQFFTSVSTAEYMASLIRIKKPQVRILDAGGGNAMLAAAAVQKLLDSNTLIQRIEIVIFETDHNIKVLLEENIKLIKSVCENAGIELRIDVLMENFIIYNQNLWKNKDFKGDFDIVICNPPYSKIRKCAEEAQVMSEIVYGQPNIYYLFMAMACHLLRTDGDFIFITPRSWTSGLYFKKFRKYLLENLDLRRLHLFVSRDKVFNAEAVLQETIIIYGQKSKKQQQTIDITTCYDTNDFQNMKVRSVLAQTCLPQSENYYVLIPTEETDIETLDFLSRMEMNPRKAGYQFKTGQVVEFRNKDNLRQRKEKDTIPLIQACNLIKGEVHLNIKTDKAQFFLIDNEHTNVQMENRNTIMLKRFTSKEETRRLQPAVHLKEKYPDVKHITAENHVNYLVKTKGDMSPCEVYGFYVILSSDIWDRYYRILNGNTQVNSAELNDMPIPDEESIQKIGRKAIQSLKKEHMIKSDAILRSVLS